MSSRFTDLSPEKRMLLLRQLNKKRENTSAHIDAQKRDTNTFPLSFAQQRLWFLDQLEPGNATYLISKASHFHGTLDVRVVERCLHTLIARHESLRTTFQTQEGSPVQVIHEVMPFNLPIVDLCGLEAEPRALAARQLVQRDAMYPCDLTQGPLLRLTVLFLGNKEYVFLLTMHHIISDGWSNDVFMRELTQLYQAFMQGKPSPLPPLPIQYADFAVWQRHRLQGETLQKQLDYWEQQLGGASVLELPTDHPRPLVQTFHAAEVSQVLPETLSAELQVMAKQAGVTLFMLLLASFQVLLARYSGQTDISVGTPIANRGRRELEQLIGFFVNTLVMRTQLTGNPTFQEVLQRVRDVALGAYAHQDVPFEQLVDLLQPERDLGRTPLFQVMFTLQQMPVVVGTTATRQDAHVPAASSAEHRIAKFDLSVEVVEQAQGLRCSLQYNTDVFAASTIQHMLQHWQALLNNIVARPRTRLSELSLLTQEERMRILATSTGAATSFANEESLPALFARAALLRPDAIAIVSEQGCFSYGTLHQFATHVAASLRARGVQPQSLVALCLERSLEGVVALLGLFYAGCVLVPLDPSLPTERLELLLHESQAALLITREALGARFLSLATPILCLDTQWDEIRQATPFPRVELTGESLAYVLSTSGSTGRPKGVLVSHAAIGNRIAWGVEDASLGAEDRVLQIASWSFDIALWELFGPWTVGATVVMASTQGGIDSTALLARMQQEQVTVAHFVPSLLSVLLEESALRACAELRCVMCGGEAVSTNLVRRFFEVVAVPLHQFYGPTEAAISVTRWRGTQAPEQERVPIGQPISNATLYLVDQEGQLVGEGMRGEVWIGGVGVAWGYLGQPDVSAERFVPDPFSGTVGARVYRTGDLARYLPDGNLLFCGRSDEQVKIRGYRVEPGEIKAVLDRHPEVRESVIVVQQGTHLVAYVVDRDPGVTPSAQSLRAYLREKLPEYMVPTFFVGLDALPLLPNGKLNRRALPSPEMEDTQELASTAQQTPLTELLTPIWQEILGRPQIGLQENFFEVGGHSLLATRLISQIRTRLQLDLPLRSLFEAPTIAGLAQHIAAGLAPTQATPPPLVPVPRMGDLPLSFAQQRLWFLDQLEPESTAYLIPAMHRLHGTINQAALERSLYALQQRHESLRTTFPVKDGQPQQRIEPLGAWHLPVIDLRGVAPQVRKEQMRRLRTQEAHHPCDLARGPLLRVYVLQLDEEEQVLLLTMHHIISDGWSSEVLWREVVTLYQAFAQDKPSPLPPLPIQYADFAVWQRQWLQGETLQKQLDYWEQQLGGASVLELPTDHPRPLVQTFHASEVSQVLPETLSAELHTLANQTGVTLFMLLLASFQVLLARYSGQADISVGTPIANRGHRELEQLIGFFVNTLVMRTQLTGNPTFQEVLQQVRDVALGAYAHQDVPFEQLVDLLQPERNLDRTPLFQVMFTLQQMPVVVEGTTVAPQGQGQGERALIASEAEQTTAKFDLSATIVQRGQGVLCTLQYNTDVFAASTIQHMLQHWFALLSNIVAHPRVRLSELSLLTQEEHERILATSTGATTSFANEESLPALFAQAARLRPDAIAIVNEQGCFSYGTLHQFAAQVAASLRARGVQPQSLVALCLERSLEGIVALLGLFYAGCVLVPLDPSLPIERLELLLHESQAVLLITREALGARFLPLTTPMLCLDTQWDEIVHTPPSPRVELTGESLAYVLSTSGSTGRPKGVLVSHAAIGNRIAWGVEDASLEAEDRVLQIASWSFDIALWELFGPWTVGATVVMASTQGGIDSTALLARMQQEQVTVAHFVPSLLSVLLEEAALRTCEELRCVMCGGEAVSTNLVRRFFEVVDVPLHQFYGPTEAAISVTRWRGTQAPEQERVPIGQPISNATLYLVDPEGQLVGEGMRGEVWIGGVGVAWGYLGQPDVSAERFVPDPFSGTVGARVYRTGDLARYLPDGNLQFCGRSDEQVKIRGYRVEPGEIKAVLDRHPEVRESVIIVQQGMHLIAYVVGRDPDVTPSASSLRAYLREKLPEYMVPTFFVSLDALPLLPNGKLNRRALPPPEMEDTQEHASTAQQTPLTELLTPIWQEILGRSQIGLQENFFEVGGHSLLATRLISQIRTRLQLDLPLRSLFEAPTIAGLAQHIAAGLAPTQATPPPLVPVLRTGDLPLSFAQQRLWFLDQLEPESTAYLIPAMHRLHGPINQVALERSLYTLQQRHESLRTTFPAKDGQPQQRIEPLGAWRLPVIDLRGVAPQAREEQTRRLRMQEAHHPCDLTRGPLLRVYVLQLDEEEQILLLTLHHIISDGWSSEVLWREVVTLYQAFAQSKPSPLPPLAIQYADFAVWQRQWLQGETLQKQLDYWEQQLGGASVLELPTDHPRPLVQTFHASEVSQVLPETLSAELHTLANQTGVTLFMLLLASFQVLLARYSGQADISVGTPIANRGHRELEQLIGFFVNTLVMRTQLTGNPTFQEVLQQVRDVALGAYAHQDVPFEQLVDLLQPERNLDRTPLFQVMFTLQQMPVVVEGTTVAPQGQGERALVASEAEQTTAKFDLSATIVQRGQGVLCTLQYNTDVFAASTIQHMLQHWFALLSNIVAHPRVRLSELSLLTQEEHERILATSTGATTSFANEESLPALFAQAAHLRPDAIAIVSEQGCFSYSTLDQFAAHVAASLRVRGVQSQSLVALCLERSLEGVVAMLGLFYAGCVLVPLDPSLPTERLELLLHESQAALLITREALGARFLPITTPMLCLDTQWDEIVHTPPSPRVELTGESLAYVLSTSGSTGRPKGVLVSHAAIGNRIAWGVEDASLEAEDRVLQIASWSFDIALWELFGPWTVGATVVMASTQGGIDSTALLARMQEEQVTVAHFVPSLLSVLLEESALKTCEGLRCVMCGGEAVSTNLVRRFFEVVDVPLHQFYGPTEAAISVTRWRGTQAPEQERVPIGQPISNATLYLVDPEGQLVGEGMRGEVWIGGVGVAWGYLGQPDVSAERFVPDPFSGTAGARVYRTGDLARYLPDGNLLFCGRSDEQVKIRGYRVEPGEIKAVLDRHPEVRESVIVVQHGTHLIAYVVGRDPDVTPAIPSLRVYLREKLPEYMVPTFFVGLDALPLLPNGKLNRRALPPPEIESESQEQTSAAQQTPLTELLTPIWQEILGRPQIGLQENFFEVGGHSLLATRLISQIRTRLQLDLPLRSLFEAPTIAGLAHHIAAGLTPTQATPPPLVPVSRTQDLPLSFAQQRLWFLDQLEPESTAYLIPATHRLHGKINLAALERSLYALQQRHESLRTTFPAKDGQPQQRIEPMGAWHLPVIDLRGVAPQIREEQTRRLRTQEAQRPCDLARGPLLRVYLLLQDEEEKVLLLTMHHIISDGWSSEVLWREVVTLYQAFAQGKPSPLPPLAIQYADFAVWQRQWLQGEVLAAQLDYWRKHLTHVSSIGLPTDYPRPAAASFRAAGQAIEIAKDVHDGLLALSHREGATLFMTLLAAFQVLLMRFSGQYDIAIGTPVTNRPHKELEGLIGFFVNVLVMRTDLSGNPSFIEVLRRVREVALGAYGHQDIPFEQLVAVLQPERDLTRSPLFQITFTFQQSATSNVQSVATPTQKSSENTSLIAQGREESTAKVDLSLAVAETATGLECGIQYRTDLFAAASITRFLEHWQILLQSIISEPQIPITTLPLLSAAQQHQVLVTWNATDALVPEGICAHGLFEQQVKRTPDALAVVDEQMSLTYGELNRRANQLAWYLRTQGVGAESLVGVYGERSIQLVICFLAILKAGGGYVPLDPAYPSERIAMMLSDAQVALVLTQDERQEVPCAATIRQVCVPQLWSVIAEQPESSPESDVDVENVAYVIYTSGSTGMPKGVQVTHRGIGNLALAQRQTFGLDAQSRVLQFASLSFDASISELVISLLAGSTLFLAPRERLLPGMELLHVLEEWAITAITMPPSALAVLPVHPLPKLECLIVAGEACPAAVVARWAAGRRFYNAYGPTETTVCASIAACVADQRPPSIGTPIANTHLYVLDDLLQPVPIGVPGELYIGGIGQARGYLHRPDITAERFVPDPFERGVGARLYKTGDLVRYRADGSLEFIGRRDQQVKMRGYRIELGEIEAVISQHQEVRACVVMLREDMPGDQRLIAYIVAKEPEADLSVSILRPFLQEKLPEYMQPSAFVLLPELPLMPSGKVDRGALPSPEARVSPELESDDAPRTPIEETIAAIWCEVLGDEHIGIHENFFDLGGHSLLATQLVSRLQSTFQLELPVRTLFEAPTIAELATLIGGGLASTTTTTQPALQSLTRPPLVPVPRTQDLPLSFAQQRLWFLDQLEPESTAYLIPATHRLHGKINLAALERSLHILQQRHESLRTTFPIKGTQPIQLIQPLGAWQFPVIDLTGLSHHKRYELAHHLVAQEAQQPCDLARGPLLRVRLLQLEEEEQVVLLTMHHIIADGRSSEVLWQEVVALYQACVQGKPSPLLPLPIQYADFAVWQRQWLQGEVLEQHLAYWRTQLEGIPPLELPTDHRRPMRKTYRGAAQSLQIPLSLEEGLLALGQREQVTLFMLLLAAFQLLLARYSGQEDIAVGTPIANRTQNELEGLIGFFVNTLVMRAQIQDHLSFSDLLKQVRERALGAYAHQDIPFEYLVEMLHPERDLSRSPFFQVMFTLQQYTATAPEVAPSSAQHQQQADEQKLPTAHATAKFDLTLHTMSTAQGLSCSIEYNTDLFDATTIQHMLAHWKRLLEGIVAAPDLPVAALSLLTEDERTALVRVSSTVTSVVPSCLHDLFEQRAAVTPDKVAVVCEDEQLTYCQLNARANQLAHMLRDRGVQPEEFVGVCLERGPWLPIAILGVLKAGAAYVPLDPSYPPERLAFLLADAHINTVITLQKLAETVPLKNDGLTAICLDQHAPELAAQSMENIGLAGTVDQLAYVIYTSGSTGTPKGVLVSHANVMRLFSETQDLFQFRAEDVWTLFHSFAFDFSVWELWGALLYGGRLVVVPYWVSRTPALFSNLLVQQGVTILNQTPSAFYQLLDTEIAQQGGGESIRFVIFGGEALEFARLAPWVRRYGDQSPRLVNMYGITETTVHVTAHCVTREEVETSYRSIIGVGIADLHLVILDKHQRLVPVGVAGELYVGGMGVARGYLRRADLTAERFVPDALSGQAGGRLYRTGDRVKMRHDHTIEYLGRVDHQVKIRGYRIELGEIEQALRAYEGVAACVVVLRGEEEGSAQLVAYVQPQKDEKALEAGALRLSLQKRLPDYMVPGQIVVLEQLPLLPNGKLDRRALPAPQAELTASSGRVTLPRTPIEVAIADIWCEVLGNELRDIHENFFASGGHSLLATQLISRLQALFQIELPVRTLFEAPTIAGLAHHVGTELARARSTTAIVRPPLLPVSRTQPLPLSFAQQRLWLIDQLEPGITAYIMINTRRLQEAIDSYLLERSIEALVRRHESLRTTFHIHEGQPVQHIHPVASYSLPIIDMRGLVPSVARAATQRLAEQEAQHPFDLARGPLLRTFLIHVEPKEHLLLLTMHHIISDGWSGNILQRELTQLYRAFEAGQPSPLAPLSIQYADYAAWQRQWLQGEVLEEHLAYWMRQLSGVQTLILPTDHPRPAVQSHRGLFHAFVLSEELSRALISLSNQEGTTLFMTLLAAFQVLLYRYSGQQDSVIGADSAGRNQVETEPLIGFFINLLVLRTNLAGTPSFRDVLGRVRETVLQAYTYQETPFELLVEKLAPHHDMNSMPLIQALFVMQNTPTEEDASVSTASNDSVASIDEVVATKFDMALFVQERKGLISGGLNYSSDLFDAHTIATLIARFEILLKSIVAHPDMSIDRLDFFSENEQKKRAKEESLLRNELRAGRGKRFTL